MSEAAALLYALMCLVLVASALAARRPSMGDTVRMALAWIAIFALFVGLYLAAHGLGWAGSFESSETPAAAGQDASSLT